jgi:hypothetical protein
VINAQNQFAPVVGQMQTTAMPGVGAMPTGAPMQGFPHGDGMVNGVPGSVGTNPGGDGGGFSGGGFGGPGGLGGFNGLYQHINAAHPLTLGGATFNSPQDLMDAFQGYRGELRDWRQQRPEDHMGMQDWRQQRPTIRGYLSTYGQQPAPGTAPVATPGGGTTGAPIPGNTGVVPPNMLPPNMMPPQQVGSQLGVIGAAPATGQYSLPTY